MKEHFAKPANSDLCGSGFMLSSVSCILSSAFLHAFNALNDLDDLNASIALNDLNGSNVFNVFNDCLRFQRFERGFTI